MNGTDRDRRKESLRKAAHYRDARDVVQDAAMDRAAASGEPAAASGGSDKPAPAGEPTRGLDRPHDPDWWLKSLIEREKLSGLGPEALLLRTEDASLDERMDACSSEQEVRSMLQEFNARIVEARRQLQGGPPVVTPLRDVEHEVQRWRSTHVREGTGRAAQHHRRGRLSGWIGRLKRHARGRQ